MTRLASGTGSSVLVERCQICDSPRLEQILFLGYLPPVNTMPPIGSRPVEQPAYPAQLLRCAECQLVQLGLIVDPAILFPPSYAYTSGTTRILRENFAQLADEVRTVTTLSAEDLVVDIGSNDGTLLSNFAERHRVLGIEPTGAAKLAIARGIPTIVAFFDRARGREVVAEHGKAKVVTATNVFAHMEDIHSVTDGVVEMLGDDGIFVSESHYVVSVLEGLQYDTIYHEHLRYYSVTSLRALLGMHGLEVIRVGRIPTHGGSIRVYAARSGRYPVDPGVAEMVSAEGALMSPASLARFREMVAKSKLGLLSLLDRARAEGKRVYGIGAPSRASTLVSYVGLDDTVIECVLEIEGSSKIGRYMPGTVIPVLDEKRLFTDQPELALLFSWHIGDELMSKLTSRGFRGGYIVPLPGPCIVPRVT